MNSLRQKSAATKFRTLHESGCFVLPNPWDIGTALYLEHLGFRALATTSAGFAFSRGKPDGGVPLNNMLAHIREIVDATVLPVNADFMGGYADESETVGAHVQLCIETGVAGLSIEDSTGRGDRPLYEEKLAVQRIRAARAAIDAGADVVAGHGPHLTLGVEIYRGRPILYSLGNFIFQNETIDPMPVVPPRPIRSASAGPRRFLSATA